MRPHYMVIIIIFLLSIVYSKQSTKCCEVKSYLKYEDNNQFNQQQQKKLGIIVTNLNSLELHIQFSSEGKE